MTATSAASPPGEPVFDAAEIESIRGIARHYERYGEYDKALHVLLLAQVHGRLDDAETVGHVVDLAYRARKIDIYLRFIETHPAVKPSTLGALRIALYHLVKGNVAKAAGIFRKHVL